MYGEKYKQTGNFKSRPPKFSWGGLAVILFIIIAIAAMAIYQNSK